MDQGTGASSRSGRHIIKRPRLTELLDGTEASLILLVAPAGYGKTTLAQQWASEGNRRALWQEVTTASTDVAVLAASVARVLSRLFPEAADLVVDRLHAGREAEADPDLLADALAARVPRWPADTWLVLDDYQNLMESRDAEQFVSRLTTFIRVLIVSRRRPTWMTARRLLYGGTREVGSNALAMTDAEAAAVMRLPSDEAASGLVSLASGWPAVIGLAALTPQSVATVRESLPETLHDYFAEELYRTFPDSLKEGLLELSLVPTITTDLTAALVGDSADSLLEQAAIHGFITRSPRGLPELHPLLRQFLRSKIDLANPKTRAALDTLILSLIESGSWDDAFSVVELGNRLEFLAPLLDTALDETLRGGRVATVRRWLIAANARGVVSPQIDLAAAEVAFREGRHSDAEMEALDAARGLPKDHALHSRALYRAAQSAQLGDRAIDALRLHQEAARTATTANDERQAIWGQFITHTELGDRDAALAAIQLFERSEPATTDDKLRQAQAHLSSSIRWGGIGAALKKWRYRLALVEGPCDPLVKTGFLQMLGTALALGAEYGEALDVSEIEKSEAERVGLDFVLPHALCMRASAETGLRRYTAAKKTLREALRQASMLGDNHSNTNARVIDAKFLLANGKADEAIQILESEPTEWPNLVMRAEFLAMRALAYACSDNWNVAELWSRASADVSDQVEAHMPARWALAIAEFRSTGNATGLTSAYDRAQETGHLDSIVFSYRAHPPVLEVLGTDQQRSTALFSLIAAVGDYALAKKFNLPIKPPREPGPAPLTTRERQVTALLCQGFSNAEIAKALWIEESTTKVHVRHVVRKLGARSRTEAAVLAAEQGFTSAD